MTDFGFRDYAGMVEKMWSRTTRKIASNTYCVRRDGYYEIILHNTIIAECFPHYVRLNSDGWRTVATKARMSDIIRMYGWSIFTKNYVWYLQHNSSPTIHAYTNSVSLDISGAI